MTVEEYIQVCADRPDLHLPRFDLLMRESIVKLKRMSREELITARSARLLSRDPGVRDAVRQDFYQWSKDIKRNRKVVTPMN